MMRYPVNFRTKEYDERIANFYGPEYSQFEVAENVIIKKEYREILYFYLVVDGEVRYTTKLLKYNSISMFIDRVRECINFYNNNIAGR